VVRPKKNNLEYFPEWKPINRNIYSYIFNIKYKALRNSSYSFIKRKDVREYIFKRDDYKCKKCNEINNLSIDHIISIRQVARGLYPIELLNAEKNLQILCNKCNSKKEP